MREGTFSIIWRHQPGELQIYEGNEDYPEPERDSDWEVFRYRADWREFDIGSGPVLVNDRVKEDSIAYSKNGFWIFDSPVALVGRCD